MKPFEHLIYVQPEDIDDLGHVNNVIYVRYVQEIASAHWDVLASEEIQERWHWVVIRHEIDYRHPAFAHDTLVGSTWVESVDGPKSVRMVKLISRKTSKMVIEARTTWCLIDAESMRPARIPPEIEKLLLPTAGPNV